jgi:hypothetical protein
MRTYLAGVHFVSRDHFIMFPFGGLNIFPSYYSILRMLKQARLIRRGPEGLDC